MHRIKFTDLKLSKEVLRAITDMGFELATPIQTQSIPALLEKKDVIGQAMTGTGKTASFAIPAIENVNPRLKKPQVLVLCPTRELATQVAEETGKLIKYKDGIHVVPIYGGQPIERQFRALNRGTQIIIGTPGRVMDHMERGTLNFDNIQTVVLDEADEMLKMGFVEDIETILKATPKDRQTVLFSATMPQVIMKLSQKYLTDPVVIKIVHETLTVPKITQEYIEVSGNQKTDHLFHLLEKHIPKSCIIFCNTKRMVDNLLGKLQARGFFAGAIHGDMTQSKRNNVMDRFKKGKHEILIATDVAARGIDVENVEMVINYDIPNDEEYYVHRIGRTGRAGRSGKAFTFIYSREFSLLRAIEAYTKCKIQRGEAPSAETMQDMQMQNFFEEVKTVIKNKKLGKYVTAIEESDLGEQAPLDIAAALLFLQFEKEKKEKREQRSNDKKTDRKRDSRRGSKRIRGPRRRR